MVVVRNRWYMSGKETYSAWKTKWPIFATQTNVQKSSLCAQYHLFQHSAQDLLRLSSMIFLQSIQRFQDGANWTFKQLVCFFKMKQMMEHVFEIWMGQKISPNLQEYDVE